MRTKSRSGFGPLRQGASKFRGGRLVYRSAGARWGERGWWCRRNRWGAVMKRPAAAAGDDGATREPDSLRGEFAIHNSPSFSGPGAPRRRGGDARRSVDAEQGRRAPGDDMSSLGGPAERPHSPEWRRRAGAFLAAVAMTALWDGAAGCGSHRCDPSRRGRTQHSVDGWGLRDVVTSVTFDIPSVLPKYLSPTLEVTQGKILRQSPTDATSSR